MVMITNCGKPCLDRDKLKIAPTYKLTSRVVDLNYQEITQVPSILLTGLVKKFLVLIKIRS